MYLCPACQKQHVDEGSAICPGCGADLQLLSRIGELPSAFFNEALKKISEQRRGEALLSAATAASLDPSDQEAFALFIHTLRRSGGSEVAGELFSGLKQEDAEIVSSLLTDLSKDEPGAAKSVPREDGRLDPSAVEDVRSQPRRWVRLRWGATAASAIVVGLIAGLLLPRKHPPPVPLEPSASQPSQAAIANPVSDTVFVRVLVQPGDSYAGFAARFYNDPHKWPKIAACNPQYPDPHKLPASVWLKVPVTRH